MKNRYIIATIVMLVVLAASSTQVGASCPCVTIDTDTINGGVYYKSTNTWPGSSAGGGHTATHTFTDVPAGAKIARIHTGVWMLGSGNVEITVNGNASGPRAASGTCDCNAINDPDMHDYCTGSDVGFITYEVTDDIPTDGGDVTVTVASTNAKDGKLYMIALLVVYENACMANMTYWINEGACYIGSGPCSVQFDGAYGSGVNDVTYWTIGVPHGISTHPTLNGNPIGNPDHHEGGAYYDFWRWDGIDTDWLNPTSNLMYYGGSGYQRVGGAVFLLEREPCLGDCYVGTTCEGTPVLEDVPCSECIAEAGRVWAPNKDDRCFDGEEPFDLCLDWCPQCCDCVDNDADGDTDFPVDDQCSCGLDPDETTPTGPIPELATFTLVGIGLMMFAGVIYRRKE